MSVHPLPRFFLPAAAAALVCGTSAFAFTKPTFPRLAGINIGTPLNYNDPNYQSDLARLSIVILGMYPGMAPGGQSMNAIVQAIKAKNPSTLVFLYVNSNELNYQTGPSAWAAYQTKLDSMKWWLYSDAAMTQKVQSVFGPGYYAINNTVLTPKDSSGNDAIDWITRYYVSTYYTPNPSIDGFFMDNVFLAPKVDGDWQRNGTVIPQSNPNAGIWLRQGYARYFSLVKTLVPGTKYQIGNITDWGAAASLPTEYQGMVNGGVMEGYVGKSWSVEAYAGWQVMLNYYRRVMSYIAEPKLGIFNQWGDPTDYQSFRYGFASCLLGDGYYSFTSNQTQYSGVVWFDEYNTSLGAAQLPPTASWQNGVWRRDFDNAISLVNPKGNGAQTVTLESAFIKLNGAQDPVTNNGQTVTTVTLKDRDGVILIRKTPLKRPQAPASITIQH
jgi:hypothetical protein